MDNYIDGGLRAHNPSLSALSVIENYYNTNSINQRLSLVVSVGCGKFPSKDIGDIDIEKYLFLDRKWSNPLNFTCEVKNLIQVFLHAVSINVLYPLINTVHSFVRLIILRKQQEVLNLAVEQRILLSTGSILTLITT